MGHKEKSGGANQNAKKSKRKKNKKEGAISPTLTYPSVIKPFPDQEQKLRLGP